MRLATALPAALGLLLLPGFAAAQQPTNPQIDFETFAQHVQAVGALRAERRLSEQDFIRLAAEPDTVVLDARSRDRFELLHVAGAVNLPLPDITAEALAQLIPTPDTRVLIYCNNNFRNQPQAFPTKAPAASLNLHTFTVLQSYGYTNVYELAPLIEYAEARIAFAGSLVAAP